MLRLKPLISMGVCPNQVLFSTLRRESEEERRENYRSNAVQELRNTRREPRAELALTSFCLTKEFPWIPSATMVMTSVRSRSSSESLAGGG